MSRLAVVKRLSRCPRLRASDTAFKNTSGSMTAEPMFSHTPSSSSATTAARRRKSIIDDSPSAAPGAAVEGHRAEDAALHQVDEQRPHSALDDVAADGRRDALLAAVRLGQKSNQALEIPRSQDVGERREQGGGSRAGWKGCGKLSHV